MKEGALTLVLASGSPRRRELLSRLGLEVKLLEPDVDEAALPGEAPALHALRLAREKAMAGVALHPGLPCLGADTVVVLGERIFGKPANRQDAAAMLAELAGRTHVVLTALALRFGDSETAHLESAEVTMVPHSRELFGWYVASGECDDKAGSYAVQGKGAVLVERIAGNVQAVIGLPLAPLPDLFARVGLQLAPVRDSLILTRRA
jgi:septum formation protein